MRDLRQNLQHLVRRWAVVVVMVLVGGGAGWLYTVVTAPTYAASSVVIATVEQPTGDRRDVSFAQAYGRLVGQQDIATTAAEATRMTADQVRKSVQATTSPDSPMIEITGAADSPDRAADLVNAVANAIVDVAGTRLTDTGVRLLVLSAAVPPQSPTSPDLAVDIAVGTAAGFLLGGLFALGRGGRWSGDGGGEGGSRPVERGPGREVPPGYVPAGYVPPGYVPAGYVPARAPISPGAATSREVRDATPPDPPAQRPVPHPRNEHEPEPEPEARAPQSGRAGRAADSRDKAEVNGRGPAPEPGQPS